MADQAHEWTDEQINRLHRRLAREYSQAAMEMRTKLNSYLEDYGYANQSWKDAVRSGEATKEQYRQWLKSQSVRRDYLADMCDTLARDATRTNQLAADMINDELPRVYAENANYAAYGIESHLGRNTHAFDLVDQSTVRRLMGMTDDGQVIKEVTTDKSIVNPPLVTMRKLNLDEAKDVRWNRQKFNAALTQSILQGESIPNTAKRMARVLNMGQNMAVRAARTAMTSAENAGRVDSYQRAKRLGIDLEQEWLATLDERTRHSHRELDGQHVPVGGKFKVPSSGHELEFPGDPKAHPSEVWSCRCTLVAWFHEDGEESAKGRFSRLPKGMTYEEWKRNKEAEKRSSENKNIVNGTDMTKTWEPTDRNSPLSIREIIHAQGFDGKPTVLSAAKFDKAVSEANSGAGLIMQRAYGAQDQDVLDAYRNALYDGDFYVDCSGGHRYGRGMYASFEDGTAPSRSMERTSQRYARSHGAKVGRVETMTLDPTARVIEYEDLMEQWENEEIPKWMREGDDGVLACALGFDAIRVSAAGEMVVLNRTKLIIRG